MGKTRIEWASHTWSPLRGCSMVSDACSACYAMRMAHRFSGPGRPFEGLTKLTKKGPVWTGEVRLVPEKLSEPLRWRKPRRVFVCSMADLFHESVPFEYIAAVFGVMAATPQHQYMLLTKRADRAPKWFSWAAKLPNRSSDSFRTGAPVAGYLGEYAIRATDGACNIWLNGALPPWPLPNVHLGVSVEDPSTLHRIDDLLRCPAAVHWISAEPLLADTRLDADWLYPRCSGCNCHVVSNIGECPHGCNMPQAPGNQLRWLVAGAESGPGARPMLHAWVRSLRDQCVDAGVPFFLKQMNENEDGTGKLVKMPELDGVVWDQMPGAPR